MNHSGDAAEQIVRMSLEGVEVAARITGTAAKEIALLLLAALKNDGGGKLKTKGRARLESMLKSGKALEIFSVRERDLQTFVREAKRYGIVYCVLRNSKHAPDGLCDVMVKADDAPKINRIVERFKFAAVDKAKIESEIVQDMAAKNADTPAEPTAGAEPVEPEINDIDRLLDELMGTDEGKAAPERTEAGKEAAGQAGIDTLAPDAPTPDAPTPEKTTSSKPAPKKGARGKKEAPIAGAGQEPGPLASGGSPSADSPATDSPPPRTSPSGPSFVSRKNSEKTTSTKKPSVKEELREIAAARKAREAEAEKREEPAAKSKQQQQTTTHTQPKNRRKSNKSKGR
jgi:hypothetical protein